MIYWFTEPGHAPEEISYHASKQKSDEVYLRDLVTEISNLSLAAGKPEERFPRSEEGLACRFCVYRSLCERGEAAGSLDEGDVSVPEIEDLEFDLDDIREIEF